MTENINALSIKYLFSDQEIGSLILEWQHLQKIFELKLLVYKISLLPQNISSHGYNSR